MTISLVLTPEEETTLSERATRNGQDLTGYVHWLIRKAVADEPLAPQEPPAPQQAGRTLEEILAPVHENFRRSGMTEEELEALIAGEIAEVRRERRERESPAS